MKKLLWFLSRMAYGCPPHPAIERRSDGGWYCTECGAPI